MLQADLVRPLGGEGRLQVSTVGLQERHLPKVPGELEDPVEPTAANPPTVGHRAEGVGSAPRACWADEVDDPPIGEPGHAAERTARHRDETETSLAPHFRCTEYGTNRPPRREVIVGLERTDLDAKGLLCQTLPHS